jgi:hypothetical protein
MQKYDIVIARFNENLDWINDINRDDINIKIYNKGEDDINFKSTKLENFGRDPHTFIIYIIENYDNLPEYVVFLQGNPIAHHKDVINTINNHVNEQYICLSDHVIDEHIVSWYENLVDTKMPDPYPNMKRYSLIDTSNAILGTETPIKCTFAAGQQYIVNKKYILNRNIEFYKNLLERFKIDYVLPWHVERLWFYIWKF